MRLRLPLSAAYVCRVTGHNKAPMLDAQGWCVRVVCLTCKEAWPALTVKEVMHRDRQDMGSDCVTLGKCSTDGHTNEWPCDFS